MIGTDMPLYSIKNMKTGEVEEKILSWKELQEYLAQNPDFTQCLNAPKLVDPFTVGRIKTDNGFNDLMKEMKKTHKHNSINSR